MHITVKMLSEFCDDAISKGLGNRKVLISRDDEGNDFHALYYGFTTDQENIQLIAEDCGLEDQYNLNEIILLG